MFASRTARTPDCSQPAAINQHASGPWVSQQASPAVAPQLKLTFDSANGVPSRESPTAAQRHATDAGLAALPPPMPYGRADGPFGHGHGPSASAPPAPGSSAMVGGGRTPSLEQYNNALRRLQDDINDTMHPLQRHTARVLNVLGSTVAVGAAIATGVLGVTAFASAATGVGLPVAAVAALAGLGVGLVGLAGTVIVTAGIRALLRKNIATHPQLAGRIDAARALRDTLASKPKLTQQEKRLLKNARLVLGKVEGWRANLKAQMKTSGKTTATIGGSVAIAALFALSEQPFLFGPSLPSLGPIGFEDSALPYVGGSAVEMGASPRIFEALGGNMAEAPIQQVYRTA